MMHDMESHNPSSPDVETVWDNVRGAVTNPDLLNELLQKYRPILVAHLVYNRRIDRDRAEDIVQEFVQKKILERDLLEKADPEKGRFRSLLKAAIDRFQIFAGLNAQEPRTQGGRCPQPNCSFAESELIKTGKLMTGK